MATHDCEDTHADNFQGVDDINLLNRLQDELFDLVDLVEAGSYLLGGHDSPNLFEAKPKYLRVDRLELFVLFDAVQDLAIQSIISDKNDKRRVKEIDEVFNNA